MPPHFLQPPSAPLATWGGIVGLLLAGFLWDLTTPLGYVPWLLYLPALLLTLALPYRWDAPALAGLCTLLILSAHLVSPLKGDGNPQAALFNRTLGIAILWLMAGAGLLYKRVEDRLRKNDARFRVIFEQAAVGVVQIDTATGRFVHANQRYCEIVGLSAERMTASTFMDLTHAADLQEGLDNMARLVAGEIHTFTMDTRYVRPDGSIVWVTLTVSPMWAPGERPDYHIAVVEDITARKRAEEKLDLVYKELQDILDSAPAMIWYKDKENRILRANKPAAESIGLSPQEIDQPVEPFFGEPEIRIGRLLFTLPLGRVVGRVEDDGGALGIQVVEAKPFAANLGVVEQVVRQGFGHDVRAVVVGERREREVLRPEQIAGPAQEKVPLEQGKDDVRRPEKAWRALDRDGAVRRVVAAQGVEGSRKRPAGHGRQYVGLLRQPIPLQFEQDGRREDGGAAAPARHGETDEVPVGVGTGQGRRLDRLRLRRRQGYFDLVATERGEIPGHVVGGEVGSGGDLLHLILGGQPSARLFGVNVAVRRDDRATGQAHEAGRPPKEEESSLLHLDPTLFAERMSRKRSAGLQPLPSGPIA
jgi:PAS domain S-box-containing protein